MRLLPLLLTGLGLLFPLTPLHPADPPSLGTLDAETERERVYHLTASPGIPRLVRVDTEDQPLVITWSPDGPQGAPSQILDSPVDRTWLVIDGPGRMTVALDEAVAAGGTGYRVAVSSLTDPTAWAAAQAGFEATLLLMERDGDADRRALERLTRAVEMWRQAGAGEDAAYAVLALARVHRRGGDTESAIPLFEQAYDGLIGFAPGAAADALDGLGLALLGHRPEDARGAFDQALALRRDLGYASGLAISLGNLCYAQQVAGELDALTECYGEALEQARRAGRPGLEAHFTNNLGGVRQRLGEPEDARGLYRRALDLLPESDRRVRPSVLVNLGVVHRRLGELGEAVVQYNRVLPIFREQGNRRREAWVLHNLASVYAELGEAAVARRHYEEALGIRRRLEDHRRVAATLNGLGFALLELGETAAAVAAYEEALGLYRELGDLRGEVRSAGGLGTALRSSQPERALELLEQAARRIEDSGDLVLLSSTERRLAEALRETGRPEAAAGVLRRLLDRIDGVPLTDLRLDAERQLAELELEAGRLPAALAHAEAAAQALETLRASVPHAELRATLWATRRPVLETRLDILLEMHRRAPEAGHDRAALEVSERARARALLDLVTESGVDFSRGEAFDGELRDREATLRRRIRGKLEERLDHLGDEVADEAARLDAELSRLHLELGRVELAMRHRNPAYELLARPRPLTATEVQALLPAGTVLLEYALGERRSHLWAVTRETIRSFELPAREGVEAAARRVYEHLSVRRAGGAGKATAALAALSRLVLEPAADLFPAPADGTDGPRLVIVPDGALHFVPFAALPHPATGRPLVESHEIAHLPSATVLAAQRRVVRGGDRGEGLAVLADPVFSVNDERLNPATPAVEAPEGRLPGPTERGSGEELTRLPASRWEADAIAELLPADAVWKALGFTARREDVLEGRLADYRFVHFATHGIIDAETPRASGLLLSRYEPGGDARQGFLSLADIYGLDLRAELVVLSGCETALGREVRWEGLMGLTHGFLHAGAERVMASLWRVQDRATAELMRRFYRALLVDGLAPAAALRVAQRSIRRNRRWRDPYYWAPFIVQGDWQGPVAGGPS